MDCYGKRSIVNLPQWRSRLNHLDPEQRRQMMNRSGTGQLMYFTVTDATPTSEEHVESQVQETAAMAVKLNVIIHITQNMKGKTQQANPE